MRTWLSMTTLALILAAPAEAETLRESSSQVSPASGVRAVLVENSRGTIQVTPSSDGQIHLTALKEVRAASSSERRRLADQITVDAGNEGGTYTVHVNYGGSGSVHLSFWDLMNGADLPRTELKLSLAIPPALPVTLHSASGDLSTTGISGPQRLESASGDVDLHDAGGDLEVSTMSGAVQARGIKRARMHTGSGDCEISDASGPLTVHTGSGDIAVRGAKDSLDVTSGSGDLDIERAPRGLHASTASGRIGVDHGAGSLELDSASGDVEVGLEEPLSRADVLNESGNVKVNLAGLSGVSIQLETASGSIDATAPMRVKSADRHQLVATLGSGRSTLRVRTSSGDIQLTNGGR